MTRKVTIIILTWNCLAYTKRCLDTLRQHTDLHGLDVIVVDNGSSDGTVEFLRTLDWVRLIANDTNLGFVRGNNIGIRHSDPRSDILLLNNDIEISQHGWLETLQQAAHSADDIGIVGCRLVLPDKRLLHAGTFMPVETLWGQQIGSLEKDVNQYNQVRDVQGIVFACAYITRDVIDRIGLLDEDYFSYFEDTDYCLKAERAGYRVVCCGSVTLLHHQNVSTAENKVEFSSLFETSQDIFRRKWKKTLLDEYAAKVLWHSTFDRPIGYAMVSKALAIALDEAKVWVAYRYLYGSGTVFPVEERIDRSNHRINLIRNRKPDAKDPQVVFGQGDAFGRNFGRFKIGYTMLEVNGLPDEWVRQANMMDEVWVPSPFNAVTFQESGVRRPISVMPLGIDADYFNPAITGHRIGEAFTFLSVFEWGERKAPEVLLRAFNEAFRRTDEAVLLCKVVNSDLGVNVAEQIKALRLRPDGGRIEFLLNTPAPYYQLGSLYRSADCFVLPTRGEGWGMPILEAMACGLPVIATDWSAHRAFMNDRNAYPLRVKRLIPAVAKCPYYTGFQWADPDEDHLRHLLRYVYEHRDEAEKKGLAAAEEVSTQWTLQHAAAKIKCRLGQIQSATSGPFGRFRALRGQVQPNRGERLRVGIDMSRTVGERTGVGSYALNLVKGLAKIDQASTYVLLPGFGSFVHPEYEALGVYVPPHPNFRLFAGRLPAFDNGRGLRDELSANNRVDVAHSTAYAAPAVGQAKLIVTIHDLTFLTHAEHHLQENIDFCVKQMALARERADLFIVVSDSTKHDLMKLLDISEEKVRVIYEAVDETFRPITSASARAEIVKRYALPERYLLCVGSIEPRKNVAAVLKVYAALLYGGTPGLPVLAIAGAAGWLNSAIYDLVKELRIEGSVKFLGYVPDTDLPALYSGANVFLYPSLYEGFGLPLLEAMSCGCPVISSNLSSMPEVVGDGGLLVNPHDLNDLKAALEQVLSDKGLQEKLGAQSIERASHFSLEKMAAETLQVYREVAESKSNKNS